MTRKRSGQAWLIAPVLLTAAVSVVGLGGPVAGDDGREQGPPDTYVAAWDAVGAQAFTAAGLSPARPAVTWLVGGVRVSPPNAVWKL